METNMEKQENFKPDKLRFFDFWFKNHLSFGHHIPNDKLYKYNTVINLSSDINTTLFSFVHGQNYSDPKKYFWFPMNESTNDMGINSIYGALSTLYYLYLHNFKMYSSLMNKHLITSIYVHCDAGVNRSIVIMESLVYLITGNKVVNSNLKKLSFEQYCETSSMFIDEKEYSDEEKYEQYVTYVTKSMIDRNIESGNLGTNYYQFLDVLRNKLNIDLSNTSIEIPNINLDDVLLTSKYL